MTSNEIDILRATSPNSTGGSRIAIILENTVIKLPRDISELPRYVKDLTEEDFFKEARLDSIEGVSGSHVGIEQNIAEAHIWEICPEHLRYLLCPIIESGFTDKNVPYLIMKRAKTYVDYHDEESYITRSEFQQFLITKLGYTQNEMLDLIRDIVQLSIECRFERCDIFNNLSNVGTIDGRLVLIDYGWNHFWNEEDVDEIEDDSYLFDPDSYECGPSINCANC